MKALRRVFSVYSIIGLMIFGFAAQAEAQGARSEKESRRIAQSLNAKVDDLRFRLTNETNGGVVSASGQNTGNLPERLSDLQRSIGDFQEKLDRRRENAADVSTVLSAAKDADDAVNSNRLGGRTQQDWKTIRALLDRLAANYNVNWRWDKNSVSGYPGGAGGNRYPNDNGYPDDNRAPNNYPPPSGSFKYDLTGTYRLDTSRSENTKDIADRAIDNGGARDDADARRDLQEKLQAPEQLAVEVRGSQVSLASSRAERITFAADGRDRSEQTGDGKQLRVRSTLRGQELTVSSLGGETDYTVVFTSIENGRAMRVMRRITTDYLNQTVFAESIYLKTDSVARPDLSGNSDYSKDSSVSGNPNDGYSSSDSSGGGGGNYPNGGNGNTNNYPAPVNGRTGNFVVRNGTILTGTLQNEISTKASQNNDRFRMNVVAPNEYRGAVIEGKLSGLTRSGKVSGSSQITFNFETIRLANGQTYDFAGFLQSVTDAAGNRVKVDSEGTARGNSQTRETVKRGGIGAGIGAIIGAIAGGGQGAAIGAIIGGGAGAGSVIVQGKNDLELKAGSSITVQSSSPLR